MDKYPRVLIVALGRINEFDSYNNGLFLRSVFGSNWPRERLAQIYSSGDTGDRGFFGSYFKLGPSERFLGKLFYRLKSEQPMGSDSRSSVEPLDAVKSDRVGALSRLKYWLFRLFVDSGVYELVFRPRLSDELMKWVDEFKPDIILAQGYNLTFSWLPVLIKRRTGAKLAVLTTDDWPMYLYRGFHGEPLVFRGLMRPIVERAARDLFVNADIPFAFGQPMADEYSKRYSTEFVPISHSDDPSRFISSGICRLNENVKTIVSIGTFNDYRWPLLLDADNACAELNRRGLAVRLAVISSAIADEGRRALSKAKFIDIYPDPGHDKLPAYLKGGDALLLIEGFDEGFVTAIELSVSSKAHLYMFSQRPIVVYAAPRTGIAKYADGHDWAKLVSKRSVPELIEALESVLVDSDVENKLVAKANSVAKKFHTHEVNQKMFRDSLLLASGV